MKNYAFIIAFVLLVSSCSKIGIGPGSKGSTTLGGSTDIPINTVGNKFSTLGANIDGNWVDLNSDIEIIKSENGVNTVKVYADLSSDPKLAAFNQIIPDDLKDDQGRVSFEGKVKVTSDGWLDYSNVDEEPVVAVKYDGKVGDKYSVTTTSGSKVEREITYRSTDDDFEYGFFLIKVIKVEQETAIPGIKKYVGYFNHKFGLVGLEIIAEDGSKLETQVSADMY